MKSHIQSKQRFAVCVNNHGYEAALEIGKLYRVKLDDDAASHGYIRGVEESGEDYAYSIERFYPLDIPPELERALQVAV